MITGWTTRTTPVAFVQVVKGILDEAPAMGLTVFGVIDHAQNACEVGLDLAAETVIIFGNAQAGTPLMVTNPEVGYELPLRLLVWEVDGTTQIGYRHPESVAAQYGVHDQPRLQAMAHTIATLVDRALHDAPGERAD